MKLKINCDYLSFSGFVFWIQKQIFLYGKAIFSCLGLLCSVTIKSTEKIEDRNILIHKMGEDFLIFLN